jgi:hypothetical protein
VSDQEMIAAAVKIEQEGDPLTKAWCRELLRIGGLIDREPWEEALLDVTIELGPTMKKNRVKHPLDRGDRLLLDVLRLLVLPSPQNPQGDRDKALATLAEPQRLAWRATGNRAT